MLNPSEAGATMRTQRRELAHTLLVELLAYQFASPVQWIKTQDQIFGRSVQRCVEVGPNSTLAGLAKRTLAAKYAFKDEACGVRRETLHVSKDVDAVYHHAPEPIEAASVGPTQPPTAVNEAQAATNMTETPQPQQTSSPATATPAAPVQQLDDIGVTAIDVVRAIVAQKLRKPFEELPIKSSIKDLVGGKSTLQNELIGDLGEEFGSLPDGAEDKALVEVAEQLQGGHGGSLGKKSMSLVSKMISAKMPAGFNMAACKEHLQSQWGLGPGRQASCFAIAVTSEPPTRLGDVGTAKSYWSSISERYASANGVSLSAPSSMSSGASGSVAVDPAALEALQEGQKKMYRRQMKALAKYLDVDLSTSQLNATSDSEQESMADSDLWALEHGEQYLNGIKPVFKPEQGRHYDSWWNWARQEVVQLFQDAASALCFDVTKFEERWARILNRADATLVEMLVHMVQTRKYLGTPTEYFAAIVLKVAGLRNLDLNIAPTFRHTAPAYGPKTVISKDGSIKYLEEVRNSEASGAQGYVDLVSGDWISSASKSHNLPVHLRTKREADWTFDLEETRQYVETLRQGTHSGLTFSGKVVLVTGAGPGSIGFEVVKGLLEGGASVIVTSSRGPASAEKYQALYRKHAGRGSELRLVGFNQASTQDCEKLIDWIYNELQLDVDAIVPFAAIPEAGREIDGIDSQSELAHRLMLTNTIRLFGHIKKQKQGRRIDSKPAQVVLPLSPNHGIFGGDGLYSESKIGLESLFQRWYSESWAPYLLVCGAVIGWTRGTGLMNANNVVAEAIESKGLLTFSTKEMAFNILGLMSPSLVQLCQSHPVYADLSGSWQSVPNLQNLLKVTRVDLKEKSTIRKALALENSQSATPASSAVSSLKPLKSERKAHMQLGFPKLPSYEKLSTLNLRGMTDLSRVVVIAGFSELGPLGNSRTRWDMETQGDFSLEGYIEMAWIMGLIKNSNGKLAGSNPSRSGWIDSKTQEPVEDHEIPTKYGTHIREHSGIRLVDPNAFGGYDPNRKELLHEVAIEEDLEPFEASKSLAESFQLQHGDKVSVQFSSEAGDEAKVQLKKGAILLVPKAVPFSRLVAGQIPTGWDPKRYGVPEDLVQVIDPITLYVLCAASEALLSAGIRDPFEIYKYIHVSMLGNCIGSGAGGANALRGMYRERYMDNPVQKDVLQETFINTVGAWLNMTLLGSSGTNRTPVGACATSLESLDIGYDAIVSGKAKMCFVGGTDDFNEELSQEFANMGATSNSLDEQRRGRKPSEMSRPTASTRSGFMESHGSGVQIICSAELALEMGLPVYGVVASTAMATDKIGRSVPAPGQGILSNARQQQPGIAPSPLLDINYRRSRMDEEINKCRTVFEQDILARLETDTRLKYTELSPPLTPPDQDAFPEERYISKADQHTRRTVKDIKYYWGNEFARNDPEISPLTAALAAWNLTIDDIEVVSLHGTSTVGNDKNESDIIQQQFDYLGRSKGNYALAVAQKSLTGHPKGAAGAWMMNGALQIMNTGVVPGNRNADNVDKALRKFNSIVYPDQTLRTPSGMIKAVSVTSFGFGQKGGQAILVHPQYMFATIEQKDYLQYATKVQTRQHQATSHWVEALMTNSLVRVKTSPPYAKSDERSVLMNPDARIAWDDISGSFEFDSTSLHPAPVNTHQTTLFPIPQSFSRRSTNETPLTATATGTSMVSRSTPATTPDDECHHEAIQAADIQASMTKLLLSRLTEGIEDDRSTYNIGVDVEEANGVPVHNETFVARNFTATEQSLAQKSADPISTLAGKWCAKEAVFKSLNLQSRGAGAAMQEVEVVPRPRNNEENGSGSLPPMVILHGDTKALAEKAGVVDIALSLSHSEKSVVAIALASKCH